VQHLYRAVDKAWDTVDFLLTAKRDHKAAVHFLRKAIGQHGVLAKITIDKSGANTAAIGSYNLEQVPAGGSWVRMLMRQPRCGGGGRLRSASATDAFAGIIRVAPRSH